MDTTLADQVGLEVPADHKWLSLWHPFRNVVGDSLIGIENWPPPELYEALALAQHHGVPTRLIDLTYDPLVAAFFACQDLPPAASRIAVWSIDIQAVNMAARQTRRPIDIVTASKARNRNVAAQKALLVVDRIPRNSPLTALAERIEVHVKASQDRGDVPSGCKAVQKFSLPREEVSKLVDLLRRLGIDRVHLMPSFDGVVRELEARRKSRTDRRS